MIRTLFLMLAGLTLTGCATANSDQAGEQPAVLTKQNVMGNMSARPLPLYDVAWDNFNHRGAVMWNCREILSGDIVSNSLCHGKPRNDLQWPGMGVPPSYRGVQIE